MSWFLLGWLLRRLRRMAQLRARTPKGVPISAISRKAIEPYATVDLTGVWVDRKGNVLRKGDMSIGICRDAEGDCLHDTEGRQILAILVFAGAEVERCFTAEDILRALSTGSWTGATGMMLIFAPQSTITDRKALVGPSLTFIDASLVTLDDAGAIGKDALEFAAA